MNQVNPPLSFKILIEEARKTYEQVMSDMDASIKEIERLNKVRAEYGDQLRMLNNLINDFDGPKSEKY